MPERNSGRMRSNKDATVQNVAAYVEQIMPSVLAGTNTNIQESFDKQLSDVLSDAALATSERRYSDAIDKLEEAKDLADGIKWVRLDHAKHTDGSIDLIRDATLQENIAKNQAAHEHIMTLIRCVTFLRSAEEVMKTSRRGAEVMQKSSILIDHTIQSTINSGTDETVDKDNKKNIKSPSETKIFQCKKYLANAILNTIPHKTSAGYAFQEYVFQENDYINTLRKAIKTESGIKNKNAKMDWTSKNIAIQDHQYHTTTLTKQRDKGGKAVIVSESSIMMLGLTDAQVGAYTYIREANGQKLDYKPTGIKADNSIGEISQQYNNLSKKQRQIISRVASHVQEQNKVIPSYSDGIACVKNPRMDVISVHRGDMTQNNHIEVDSSILGHSYSIDGLAEESKITTSKMKNFFGSPVKMRPMMSKIEQLKQFFPDGQKISVDLLGALDNDNRPIYKAIKKYHKNDICVSVDSIALTAKGESKNFNVLDSTLKKFSGLLKQNYTAQLKEIEKEIKHLNKLRKNSKSPADLDENLQSAKKKQEDLKNKKDIASCIASCNSKKKFREAMLLLDGIEVDHLNPNTISKADFAHMLDTRRLLSKIEYDSLESRRQELAALHPIVMDIVDKEKNVSNTIHVMTSAKAGRTTLTSLKSAQKFTTAALGLSPIEKEQSNVIKKNFNAQMRGCHAVYYSSAAGIPGIDKQDINGILPNQDPIYANIVDENSTADTVLNTSKNSDNRKDSVLTAIVKAVFALPILPLKLLYNVCSSTYRATKNWINRENHSPTEKKHFLCAGLPALVKVEGDNLFNTLSVHGVTNASEKKFEDNKNYTQNVQNKKNETYTESLNNVKHSPVHGTDSISAWQNKVKKETLTHDLQGNTRKC